MKSLIIKEDVRLPGTNIILEKGDKVVIKEGKKKMSIGGYVWSSALSNPFTLVYSKNGVSNERKGFPTMDEVEEFIKANKSDSSFSPKEILNTVSGEVIYSLTNE